jgi:RecA-family ATPase
MVIAACGAMGGGTVAGIPVRPMRTVIVDAENGERELHRRLRSLGLSRDRADEIEVYEAHGYDLRRHLDELADILAEYRPDFLILDAWRSLSGGDENDSGEVAKVLDPLRNLVRDYVVGGGLVHHMKKGGGYRGSSAPRGGPGSPPSTAAQPGLPVRTGSRRSLASHRGGPRARPTARR